MATSPHNGDFLVELIGPSENLSKATIIFGLPTHNRRVMLLNGAYSLGFLKKVFPEWTEASDWVASTLRELGGDGERSITRGNKTLTVRDSRDLLDWIVITVEAK